MTSAIQGFLERHSFAVNVAINVLLAGLCCASYAILVALYFTQGLGVRSLMYADESTLPPTVAVPLLGVLLTGATSALLTRSVEHSLWNTLLRSTSAYKNTYYELYQLAQWSVSPFTRLLYVFVGQSWVLRGGGLLLFATALLNPILLYGVRSREVPHTTSVEIPRNMPMFSGFTSMFDNIDGNDSKYHKPTVSIDHRLICYT